MFGVLAPDVVSRRAITPGEKFALAAALQAELFMVPGKLPLYLEGDNPETAEESAANVGVEISDGNKRLAYIPGAAEMTPSLRERLSRADVILFDGTLFTDDEMIRTGTGTKAGRRMGHMPIEGEGGSLAALARSFRAKDLRAHQQHQSDPGRRLARAPPRRGRRAGRSLSTAWRSRCEAADARRTGGGAARHRRAALSPPASVPQAPARRAMHQGPGPGLGAQPLLLPVDDPDQGREPDRALRGFRDPPRMALAAGRS